MKKYLRIFLLLAVGMMIISPVTGGGVLNGAVQNGSDSGKTNPETHSKLSGLLKDIVQIYRSESRLTEENFSKYINEKFLRKAEKTGSMNVPLLSSKKPDLPLIKRSGKLFNLSSGTISSTDYEEFEKPMFLGIVLNEAIQERWGNPGYDVIECNVEMTGNIYVLNNFNVKVRAVSLFEGKTIVSVEVAAKEIEKIASLPQVIKISPVLKKELNNNLASQAIRASRIRLKSGDNYTRGYTGEGVIVGIIDSGIDWTHEDFVDPDTGETRILYIWDTGITTPGRTPADVFGGPLSGLSYGTVWTKAEIDGGSCLEIDTNGHGTHVAGSAAGNGYATGNYTGIAPNADIIAVKGLDNNGILFVYELADQLGMDCTVNMSYGPAFPFQYISWWPEDFPADGTSPEAQEIAGWNAAYGAGNIPVKSAGNEGHWNTYTDLTSGSYPYMNGSYHIEGHQSSGSQNHTYTIPDFSTIWPYNLFSGPNSTIWPWLSIGYWSDELISVTFTSPGGTSYGPFVHDGGGDVFSGDAFIFSDMLAPAAPNGHYYGLFDIFLPYGAYQPTPGNWTITISSSGGGPINYDMWCSEFTVFYGGLYIIPDEGINAYFTGNYTHANYIIDEGASPYEISVGAFTTRTGWDALDGGSWTYAKRPQMGNIADFSSPGPSRDRRVKPDIAAPGQIIMSAASSTALWSNSELDPDGEHGVKSGTSMASPMTTGAVALVLQRYPGSSLANVRSRLGSMALQDGFTSSIGNNGFGRGKLNVLPLNMSGVPILTQDRTEVILDNADLSVNFDGSDSYDPEGFPITHLWVIEDIPEGADPEFIKNNEKAILNVDPEIEGMYRISLAINDTIWDGPKTYSQWITAKFAIPLPPAGVTLERITNDLIFVNEYVNRLIWSENPDNEVDLQSYRVYRKVKGNGDDTYVIITELDTSVTGFDDRGLEEDQLFTYKITAVSTRGKESEPVIVSN